MVAVQGLFETHLTVSNLARSSAFYRDVVGLPVAHVVPERRVAFHWIGGPGTAMLGLWESSAILRLRLHFALATTVEGMRAAIPALQSVGVETRDFDGAPTDEPCVIGWMPAAALFFVDPDGHSVELLSMLPDEPEPSIGTVSLSAWRARHANLSGETVRTSPA